MFLNDIADALTAKQIREAAKKKGADGKACWDSYRYNGTENGKDKCVKVRTKEDLDEVKSAHPAQAAKAIAMKKAGIKPKKLKEYAPSPEKDVVAMKQGVAEGSDSYTVANDPDKPGMYSYREIGHALQSGHSDHAKIYKNNKFLSTVGDARKSGVAEGDPETHTRGDPHPDEEFYFPVKDQWPEKLGPMGKPKSRPDVDVKEGTTDTVTFGVDSEKAYNHVMAKFGKAISWDGDDMTAPRKYWAAIQQLAHDAGGAAEETGYERDVAETTGDKPFDNMMKTIKTGTKKQDTADRREQKQQDQKRTRDAIDNMFGSSMNHLKNLKIKEQDVEEDWKGKLAGAALAGAVGAGAMAYHDATPNEIQYRGYTFTHAPLNVKVPGSAHYVKMDGKEYLMWKNSKPALPGNPEFLYKLKSEADAENIAGMNENFEPGETKRVLNSGGKPAGEVGIDPGSEEYYFKHYASEKGKSGYPTYQAALEALRWCDKQYQYANKPADTRSEHEKRMDNPTYAEGYRDGVRGERNPRASNIFGPTSDVYDRGYEAGQRAKQGVGEDSWHGAGDAWHGTGDQWSGGGADGGAAPMMEYADGHMVPNDTAPVMSEDNAERLKKLLARHVERNYLDLCNLKDLQKLCRHYGVKEGNTTAQFVQGAGPDDAKSPVPPGNHRVKTSSLPGPKPMSSEPQKPMGIAERNEQRVMALRLAEMQRAGYFD